MAFSPDTEKLAEELFQAEYRKACEDWGEKFNSLHEGYAVLLEEIEEVKQQFEMLYNTGVPILWESTKTDDFDCAKLQLNAMLHNTYSIMQELAQVGAVLKKIQNTVSEVEADALSIKEFDTNKILTCATADKAKVGMKGYFADDIAELKLNFKNNILYELIKVREEFCAYRFESKHNEYALFYPIDEVEE